MRRLHNNTYSGGRSNPTNTHTHTHTSSPAIQLLRLLFGIRKSHFIMMIWSPVNEMCITRRTPLVQRVIWISPSKILSAQHPPAERCVVHMSTPPHNSVAHIFSNDIDSYEPTSITHLSTLISASRWCIRNHTGVALTISPSSP